MMRIFTWLGWVEPPPEPDPLDRIAHTLEASANQRTSELSNVRAQLVTMNQAMHSYHAAIVALQAENRRLWQRVYELEQTIAELQARS